MSKERPLQSVAIVIGPCWTNFCSQNWRERYWLQRDDATCHTAEATLDVLCSGFEDHIISRRANVVWPPRSCDLTPLDYYLWGAVKDKCYVDNSETIDALKDNICEAIGEIQLHTINYLLKNWTDRVGYCMASHLNVIIYHLIIFYLTGRIALANKKKNLQ